VKSYGSITTIISSLTRGAQGSPVFSELGKCWGIVVSCHNDLPEKLNEGAALLIEPPVLPPTMEIRNGQLEIMP
jgi:hypothetical protein